MQEADISSDGATPHCDLSVIICTYNRARLLDACLQRILPQLKQTENVELIVVDNNSSDHTAEVVDRTWVQCKYILEVKQGLSHARNRGLKESSGRFVAYLDDDALVSETWLQAVLNHLDDELVDAIGGPVIPHFEVQPPEWLDPTYFVRQFAPKDRLLTGIRGVMGLSGGNMAIRRSALIALGGFNTELGMRGQALGLGEETELFLRMYRRSGYRCYYVTDMSIAHCEDASKFDPDYIAQRIFTGARQYPYFLKLAFPAVKANAIVLFRMIKQSGILFWNSVNQHQFARFRRLKARSIIRGLYQGLLRSTV